MNLTAGVKQNIGNYRWTICALLFFATTVNYLDRQVLSLLKPSLEDEFHWTNIDYANITTFFQLTYSISLLFAGGVIDRLGTKKGYAIAIVIWSLAAMLHALAIPAGTLIKSVFGITTLTASVVGFMFTRALLGFGEAGNFPAAVKATAEYFPKKERSFATGIFNSGTNIGAILAPLTVPWIKHYWGWEAAFIIIGGFGFLWLIFWYVLYEKPEKQKRLSASELAYINSDVEDANAEVVKKINWLKILSYRQTWAFASGKFFTDGIWWFFLFWLPGFLKDQYHLVDTDMAFPLFILYTIAMFGSIAGGWFPVIFIKKGWHVFDARRRAMFIIALFPLLVLLARPFGDISYWVPVLLIGIGAAAHQAWSANIYTVASDIFPKYAVGSVVGFGGMAGGLGGVVMVQLSGIVLDHYKQLGTIGTGYTIMFTICALGYLAAWFVMKLLVPRYEPVEI